MIFNFLYFFRRKNVIIFPLSSFFFFVFSLVFCLNLLINRKKENFFFFHWAVMKGCFTMTPPSCVCLCWWFFPPSFFPLSFSSCPFLPFLRRYIKKALPLISYRTNSFLYLKGSWIRFGYNPKKESKSLIYTSAELDGKFLN